MPCRVALCGCHHAPCLDLRWSAAKVRAPPFRLFEAAQEGHEEVVAALIGANEIDVNRVTLRGYSPLSMACELGRENIVQLLLAAKSIDPNYALNDGSTAFSIAAKRGHATIIEDLLTHSRTNDLSSIAKPRTFWDGPKILSRLPKQENVLEE